VNLHGSACIIMFPLELEPSEEGSDCWRGRPGEHHITVWAFRPIGVVDTTVPKRGCPAARFNPNGRPVKVR
jgi:hypothetical protein